MSNTTERTLPQEISLAVKNKPKEMTFRKFGKQEESKVKGKSLAFSLMSDIKEAVNEMNNLRQGSAETAAIDLSFGEYMLERCGIGSLSDFLNLCGIDPGKISVQSLYSLPELPADSRWIIPEIFLDPIRTGFRRPAMFTELIRDTVPVSQLEVTVPQIKLADATMQKLNEGETIPMGTVAYGGKTGRSFKIGRGFRFTDEVVMFSTIQMLAPFLEDLGARMNMSQNALAVKMLIEGETSANSAATIGVTDETKGFQYRDFLYAHAAFERIGRSADVSLVNVGTYVNIKDMPEVKGLVGNNQLLRVDSDVKTLSAQSMRIHGLMPANKVMFVDKMNALRRLMVKPLMVESDRIVSRQTTEVVATAILGFMTILRDGRFLMDASLPVASNDFPTWMDPTSYESQTFGE